MVQNINQWFQFFFLTCRRPPTLELVGASLECGAVLVCLTGAIISGEPGDVTSTLGLSWLLWYISKQNKQLKLQSTHRMILCIRVIVDVVVAPIINFWPCKYRMMRSHHTDILEEKFKYANWIVKKNIEK